MDTKTVYKPPIHEHPLYYSARFISQECDGCHVDGMMYGAYFCNESYCFVWFHKECAEAPLEIDHPFHTQHHLLLTTHSGDGPCDLCGQKLLAPCYSCSTCEFKVDLNCGMKPSPLAIEHPLSHDHPLIYLKKRDEESHCEVCKKVIGGPSYSCLECTKLYFHVGCVRLSKEVNHPCHSDHPLKLIAFDTLLMDDDILMDDDDNLCFSCCNQLLEENVFYHCSVCSFSMCIACIKNPPPFVVEDIKTHKHPLTRFSKRINYNCDACGMKGSFRAYICHQCDFIIHRKCIALPHVININRHNHRISFTYRIGVGYSECGICPKSLSRFHGAYSCSICPNYAVHSRCAIRTDVWDGVELEGIPDDIKYFAAPFKVVGDNLICHFSHKKHPLKLYKIYILYSEWLRCEACMYPLGFKSIYGCEECNFFLHQNCANLPMKRGIVFDNVPYTLEVVSGLVDCEMCRTLYDGFKYTSQDNMTTDVLCASLLEPFVHGSHDHPLYFDKNEGYYCDGCGDTVDVEMLRCVTCCFDLCLYCACLPEKIWHKNDDEHPLILNCGRKASKKIWCDNCEEKVDPSRLFYTCFDCGVCLHARCVLGDFSRLKPRSIISYEGRQFEVVLNNHNTRPDCTMCDHRCKMPVILKYVESEEYICSRFCLKNNIQIQFQTT